MTEEFNSLFGILCVNEYSIALDFLGKLSSIMIAKCAWQPLHLEFATRASPTLQEFQFLFKQFLTRIVNYLFESCQLSTHACISRGLPSLLEFSEVEKKSPQVNRYFL